MAATNSEQITSRFDGVIKKLHYEAEDVAQVGKVKFLSSLLLETLKLKGRSHSATSTFKATSRPKMRPSWPLQLSKQDLRQTHSSRRKLQSCGFRRPWKQKTKLPWRKVQHSPHLLSEVFLKN